MSMLVVLGMHRSGTSALTGVLTQFGFAAGKQLMPANEFNARGYFEDARLNQRLDALLKALGRDWHDERAMPDGWIFTDVAAVAVNDLGVLMAEEFDFDQPSVIKDPRVCRLLPLLQSVWRSSGVSPCYVFSLRSPLAVMRSLAHRDGLPAQRAALLYVAHLLEAEWHTREHARVFVEYDKLLRDWRQTISQISRSLSLESHLAAEDEAFRAKGIEKFLTTELNHYTEDETAPTGVAVELAIEVYSLLKQPLNVAGLASLDDVRGRWLAYLESLEPWLSEAAHLNRLRSELPTALFNPGSALVQEASLRAKSDIYWMTQDQDYSENRKISANWRYGNRIEQRFVLPATTGSLKSLRWDITDRPAFCMIDKVWIEDPQGNVHWAWQPSTDLFDHLSADMHVLRLTESKQLQVMASGFDPYARLRIPDPILLEIAENWIICTVWQASLPTQEIAHLMQELSATNYQLLGAEAILATTIDERDSLRQQTQLQAEHLAQLDLQRQQAREEIIHAEAQLGLLKELWLGNGPMETL